MSFLKHCYFVFFEKGFLSDLELGKLARLAGIQGAPETRPFLPPQCWDYKPMPSSPIFF